MCEICRKAECPSGCPNADEPKAIYECDLCGDVIYAGDEYIDYDGAIYCGECLEMTVCDCLEGLGYSKHYAGDDDDD